MDFTKITPIEYNGQRVATATMLRDFIAEKNGTTILAARNYIARAQKKLTKGVDFFSVSGRKIKAISDQSAVHNLYTQGGVLKLAQFQSLKPVEEFAKEYFGAEEPVIAPLATPIESPADVTALTPVEWSSQRVLTTEQLAQFYECDKMQIIQNFNNNKDNFSEGQHYFKLEGESLQAFKRYIENFDTPINKFTSSLYLWTREGAVRHCKMLNTVRAWEMFNLLEENYFNGAKVKIQPTAKPMIKPAEIVREVGATSDAIQRVYKVKDGIALAQATDMVEQYYGQDLSSLKRLIPPAEHATGYLNATELGQKVGMSARTLNNRLEVIKWQWKDKNGDWRLTDEGRNYGEEMPYTRNGHSGYQIRWSEKAVEFLTKAAPPLFN